MVSMHADTILRGLLIVTRGELSHKAAINEHVSRKHHAYLLAICFECMRACFSNRLHE